MRRQGREEDLSCPVPSPPTYNLECITAVVGPPEAQVLEAKAAGEGAGQQDLRAVDSVDGSGLSHRYLQRQGHREQEETCVRGTTSLKTPSEPPGWSPGRDLPDRVEWLGQAGRSLSPLVSISGRWFSLLQHTLPGPPL